MYHVQIATISVMMKSMMNSHFQPNKPAIPPSFSIPLAMSPLTAAAMLWEVRYFKMEIMKWLKLLTWMPQNHANLVATSVFL